jgi:hypothetical protein
VNETKSTITSRGTGSLWLEFAVACGTNGQPRTFRLGRARSRLGAYRRLAASILGLDVESLAAELRAARRAVARTGANAHVRLAA